MYYTSYNRDSFRYLCHYGIKGQKWGIRRYQNPDGSLTAAGKKRIAKQYTKEITKANKTLSKVKNKMITDSYESTLGYMIDEGLDKFDRSQQKKYGKDFEKRSGYTNDYRKYFNNESQKYLDAQLHDFFKNDKNYTKAKDIAEKYKMVEWNDKTIEDDNYMKKLKKGYDEIQKRIERQELDELDLLYKINHLEDD